MDSKLYELSDGRIVVSQQVDSDNRLIYVFEDGTGSYAEDCIVIKQFGKPITSSLITKIDIDTSQFDV